MSKVTSQLPRNLAGLALGGYKEESCSGNLDLYADDEGGKFLVKTDSCGNVVEMCELVTVTHLEDLIQSICCLDRDGNETLVEVIDGKARIPFKPVSFTIDNGDGSHTITTDDGIETRVYLAPVLSVTGASVDNTDPMNPVIASSSTDDSDPDTIFITTADQMTSGICRNPVKDLRDNGDGSFTVMFAGDVQGDTFQYAQDTDQRLTNPVITQNTVNGVTTHTITWDVVDIDGTVIGQETADGIILPVFEDKSGNAITGPITVMQQADFVDSGAFDYATASVYGEDAAGQCGKFSLATSSTDDSDPDAILITTADDVTSSICRRPVKDLRDNGDGTFTVMFEGAAEGTTFQYVQDTDQRLTNPVITQSTANGVTTHTVTWDVIDIEGNVIGQESASGITLPVFQDKLGNVISGAVTVMQQSDFVDAGTFDQVADRVYGQNAAGECASFQLPVVAGSTAVDNGVTTTTTHPDNTTHTSCNDPVKTLQNNGDGTFTVINQSGPGETFQYVQDTDQKLTNPVITQQTVSGVTTHTVTWDIVDIDGNVIGQEAATGIPLPVFQDKSGNVLSGPITAMQQTDFADAGEFEFGVTQLFGEDAAGNCGKFDLVLPPSVGVSKKLLSVDPQPADVGSVVTWEIKVWNAGSTDLVDVVISDDIAVVNPANTGPLAAGATFTTTATQTITAEDQGTTICNEVSVSGTDASGNTALWIDNAQLTVGAPATTLVCGLLGNAVEDAVQDSMDYSQAIVDDAAGSVLGYEATFSNGVKFRYDVTGIAPYGDLTAPADFTASMFHSDMENLSFASIAISPPSVEGQFVNGTTNQPGWPGAGLAGAVYKVTATLVEVPADKGSDTCPARIEAQANMFGLSRGTHNTVAGGTVSSYDFGDANPVIVSQTANLFVGANGNPTAWSLNAAPNNAGLEISIEEYFGGSMTVGDSFEWDVTADRADAVASRIENVSCTQGVSVEVLQSDGSTIVSATYPNGDPVDPADYADIVIV